MNAIRWNQQPMQQNMETAQMAAMSRERESNIKTGNGVWFAYSQNGAVVMPFRTELEALRHAATVGLMRVKFVSFGGALSTGVFDGGGNA